MKIKVGVIFGGPSVEHEISVITAVQAMNSINQEKYEVIPIYITKDRTWYTGKMLMDIDVYKDFDTLKRYATKVNLVNKNGGFYLVSTGIIRRIVSELDIAFPIVHGSGMEDGTLQGYLDLVGIPYVGSGVLGSSLGQDKIVMKQIFEACNLPYVPYTWFYDSEYQSHKEIIEEEIKKLGYPVIVKPASLGSSIGIKVVKSYDELDEAITDALKYDTKVIVEKVIEDMIEVNCSVLGNYEYQQASVLEEVIPSHDFLTFDDKYIGNGKGSKSKGMLSANRIMPARIPEDTAREIQEIAKETFKVLNLSGVCRIDFIVNRKTNKVYINEPNTIPGSLSFYLWKETGKDYSTLLDELITIAIKDYKKKNKKIRSFDTNILKNFNGLKGKGLKGKLK